MGPIKVPFRILWICLCALPILLLALIGPPALAAPADYFVIRVVDQETGLGVPMVELQTTNFVSWYTDSSGFAAILEPGLMNRKVFFTVTSPGYAYPADGFGIHGVALVTKPGTRATIKLERVNIAERLCRLTGAGIYRDTVLAGEPTPLREPLLNGDVMGQDSVLATPYRGRIYWFWGDTSRPDYPLGNFGTSGATSESGLHPERGIDFHYFTDAAGFSRPMIAANGPGPVWVTGVSTIENGSQLVAYFSRIESLSKAAERGLALYNNETEMFVRAAAFPASEPLPLEGQPFLAAAGESAYLVGTHAGAAPLPLIRVPANLAALKDPAAYECFTCLKPAASPVEPEPERDANGRLVFGWKRGAPCLTVELQRKLLQSGRLKPGETLFALTDVETGKPVMPHNGSVYWNRYRGRWVMLFGQSGGGVSNVGEIWFAEADTATGPWIYCRKVATHPKMDFYNPTQHPFLDEENGRRIYFEGTFVNTFSGNPVTVPRYNYNQLLYRLSLDDSRLSLPAPVYRLSGGPAVMRAGLALPRDAHRISAVPFFAIPPERTHTGLTPIYFADGAFTDRGSAGAQPLFYALPPDGPDQPQTMPLLDDQGRRIARVWPNPQTVAPLDFELRPAGQRAP